MSRRRAYATAIGLGLLALALASAVSCAANRLFVYDEMPSDPALDQAIDDARAIWQAVGVTPPYVTILVAAPPGGSDGVCYCAGPERPVIMVRVRRADLIAHELGHAMGLGHVTGSGEIMAATIEDGAIVGPATLAEAERVGVMP